MNSWDHWNLRTAVEAFFIYVHGKYCLYAHFGSQHHLSEWRVVTTFTKISQLFSSVDPMASPGSAEWSAVTAFTEISQLPGSVAALMAPGSVSSAPSWTKTVFAEMHQLAATNNIFQIATLSIREDGEEEPLLCLQTPLDDKRVLKVTVLVDTFWIEDDNGNFVEQHPHAPDRPSQFKEPAAPTPTPSGGMGSMGKGKGSCCRSSGSDKNNSSFVGRECASSTSVMGDGLGTKCDVEESSHDDKSGRRCFFQGDDGLRFLQLALDALSWPRAQAPLRVARALESPHAVLAWTGRPSAWRRVVVLAF